ncbi:MAG: hypothetical protein ACYCU3_15060 [Streptosporangiaceae bacterium]
MPVAGSGGGAGGGRGELRVPLPVGFVYDDQDNVVVDPDEGVACLLSYPLTRAARPRPRPSGYYRPRVLP